MGICLHHPHLHVLPVSHAVLRASMHMFPLFGLHWWLRIMFVLHRTVVVVVFLDVKHDSNASGKQRTVIAVAHFLSADNNYIGR